MKTRKIRGHRRRWKSIDRWKNAVLQVDIVDYIQASNHRGFVKINVDPWNQLTIKRFPYAEPRGITKQKMLSALLDIFVHWDTQLQETGKPYDLKIWLYDPRFHLSQVVCAVDDSLEFYQNTFHKPENPPVFPFHSYGKLATRLKTLNWEYSLDEWHTDDVELKEFEQSEDKTALNFLQRLPRRITPFKNNMGDAAVSYSFEMGKVWQGRRN